MIATLEKVAAEALSLSSSDRSELMRILLENLAAEPAEDAVAVAQAWEIEAERGDEVISGRVKTIPAKAVFAKLRARHG